MIPTSLNGKVGIWVSYDPTVYAPKPDNLVLYIPTCLLAALMSSWVIYA